MEANMERSVLGDFSQDQAIEAVTAKYRQICDEGSRKGKKRRPGVSFNCNLPFGVHQEFQALTQQLQQLVPSEKSECTMTNYLIATIQTVIIPAQKKRLEELRGQGSLYEAA